MLAVCSLPKREDLRTSRTLDHEHDEVAPASGNGASAAITATGQRAADANARALGVEVNIADDTTRVA